MIIGISGKARSGKDTVADYLVNEYGFKRLGFADKLYAVCRDLFGMTEKDSTLLQMTGDTMRHIDPLVWIKHLWRQVPEGSDVVITDVRYQNEFDFLLEHGAFMLRLECSEEERIRRAEETLGKTPTRAQLDFVSEVQLDSESRWHLVLDTGEQSIEDIQDQICRLVETA